MPEHTEISTYDLYLQIQQQYPDTLVLIRVGDYLEAYNADAETIEAALGIELTAKMIAKGTRVPCAALPYGDTAPLEALLRAGHRLIIAERVYSATPEQIQSAEKMVLPGSLIEDTTL